MLQVNVTSQYVSLDHSLSNTRQYFGQNNRKSLLKKAIDGWNRKQRNCEVIVLLLKVNRVLLIWICLTV